MNASKTAASRFRSLCHFLQPPLQALWIICSNFLPLSAYNFIAAFCNCPLIGYIIPLSVKKSNIWHSVSFFLFTTNIDFAYCVLTCSFYISYGVIPSLRHIQFDMIKRCCTFLCSAAIIYWFYLYCGVRTKPDCPSFSLEIFLNMMYNAIGSRHWAVQSASDLQICVQCRFRCWEETEEQLWSKKT